MGLLACQRGWMLLLRLIDALRFCYPAERAKRPTTADLRRSVKFVLTEYRQRGRGCQIRLYVPTWLRAYVLRPTCYVRRAACHRPAVQFAHGKDRGRHR